MIYLMKTCLLAVALSAAATKQTAGEFCRSCDWNLDYIDCIEMQCSTFEKTYTGKGGGSKECRRSCSSKNGGHCQYLMPHYSWEFLCQWHLCGTVPEAGGKLGHCEAQENCTETVALVPEEGECNTEELFWSSVARGNLAEVKKLVEGGQRLNGTYKDGFQGDSRYVRPNENALDIAGKFGRLDVVKYLVEQGADIEAKSDTQMTVLERIIMYGEEPEGNEKGNKPPSLNKVAKYLIEQGANMQGFAFAIASVYDLELTKFMCQHGANYTEYLPRPKYPPEDYTSMHTLGRAKDYRDNDENPAEGRAIAAESVKFFESGGCYGAADKDAATADKDAATADKDAATTDKEATTTDKDAATTTTTPVQTVSASIKVKGIEEDELVADKDTQEAITKGFAEAAEIDAKTIKIVKIGDTSIARRLADGALVIVFEIQTTGSKTADAILKIIQSTTADHFSTKVSEHASAITVAAKGQVCFSATDCFKGTPSETFSAASTSVTSAVTAVTSAVVVAVLMM